MIANGTLKMVGLIFKHGLTVNFYLSMAYSVTSFIIS
jgi:hypothetical protein